MIVTLRSIPPGFVMLKRTFYSFVLLLTVCLAQTFGQCPINIGFDTGDFTNWEGSTGNYPGSDVVNILSLGLVPGIHTIISRASKQVDPYGQFPLVSPNGSNYIVKLGDDALTRVSGFGKAERLTFTFKVPNNDNDFSLIYYYAVIIEYPGHPVYQKPRFSAAVFDVTANKYADCGNFDFVAISTLPGFVKTPIQPKNNDVFFKNWSPVTIDLRGYAGKTLRLEFTTTNCAPSGHFSYAYIDLNQNCTSPVSGNMKCPNNDAITLSAPAGFKEYYWYNEKDFSTVIGTSNTLTPSPTPPVGTGYSVRIVPYPGIGCPDTIYTTILKTENPSFVVTPQIKVCRGETANIAAANITEHTDAYLINNGLVYYDAAMNIVPDPANITTPGRYYIQATANSGCTYIKPIDVTFLDSPVLTIHNPDPVCQPTTVDITVANITRGSSFVNNLTYWIDANATMPLTYPKKISVTNTYYIKAVNATNLCYDIKPVTVLIDNQPVLVTHTVTGCNTADLTADAVTAGSTGFLPPFRYYLDPEATQPLTTDPKAVTETRKYYIQAFNKYSCSAISAVQVNVSPIPQLSITNPRPVIFPQPVDITQTFPHDANLIYSYFLDSLGIYRVKEPHAVQRDGVYYIKAVNAITNCTKVFKVKITVLDPGNVNFLVNTFTPNGDGNNDVFVIKTPSSVTVSHFSIYNLYGQLLFETNQANKGWDGSSSSGKRLPVGTYYWIFEGYDYYTNLPVKKAGSIALIL